MRFVAAGALVAAAIIGLVLFSAAPAKKEPVSLRPLVLHRAEPSKLIKHAVEWNSVIDPRRQETALVGPRMYATELSSEPNAPTAILFSWYEFPPAAEERPGFKVRVSRDAGDLVETFAVGDASYFASQTQRLHEGTPAEIPDGLSQFVVYDILEGASERQNVILSTPSGQTAYEVIGPAFLCVPGEQWHHDEYFAVCDAASCWLVYETEATPHASSISTLDQFGLNELKLGAAEWLCVPATLIGVSSD